MVIDSLINFKTDLVKPIASSRFEVEFINFGKLPNDVSNNYGRFVSTITLPSLSFSCQERYTGGKPVWTVDEARLNPVIVTLVDDAQSEMMRQVMHQLEKQKQSPLTALFDMIVRLLDSGTVTRRIHYTGCTIIYTGHERALDRNDLTRIIFTMQVQANDIDMYDGNLRRLTEPDEVSKGQSLYDPIAR